MAKAGEAVSQRQAGAKKANKYVLGTTREGIQILRPRGNPSSFTWQQLREAMQSVRERLHP